MFFHAARDLQLKDTQKTTIEKVEASLKPEEGMRTEFKAVQTEIAAGVKAGKIDAAKLTPHYTAIDTAAQGRHDKEVEALNGLHAALDSTQRKAVTAAIRTKQAAREAHAPDKAQPADAGHPDWAAKRLEHLTKDADLDAAQQKQVAALIAKNPALGPASMETQKADAKKRMDALLTAFEADAFDAKKQDVSMMGGKKPHEMMDQQVQFLTQLLPILKPEQREKLAASMEKSKGMGRPGGDRGERGGDHGERGGLPHDDD